MKLFSKIKDYNEDLEKVLDSKTFPSNVKNLLLSMVYKLENSYQDYSTVKRAVRSQEDFFEEMIEIIKIYCENIKTVEPDSDEANLLKKNNVKALTNERERSILTYPTEISLFYAISDIVPKYFYISDDFIFKKTFQNMLVDGYNSNNLEILNNFNGWSWDTSRKPEINLVNQLIYQNLLLIFGEQFLSEWRSHTSSKKDFLPYIKDYIFSLTGTNGYFEALCNIIYLCSNEKEKKRIDEILKDKSNELKRMSSKEKYLDDAKNRKLKLTRLVEKMDFLLNDEDILAKEFLKRNQKLEIGKKINSLRVFRNIIENERQGYLKEIYEISDLSKPMNFVKKKQELEIYERILNNHSTIEDEIIKLQKEFLVIINKKANRLQTREELIDFIYELRYYQTIYIDEEKTIGDIEVLNNTIHKIMKKVITSACKLGIMKIISMDINLNFEIIKYAIETKIMDLEEIRMAFEIGDKDIIIKVYDKEVFEKQGRKILKEPKKALDVKNKKMIKLFN